MASSLEDNRGKRSMAESMKHLCLSDKLADVTFTFGKSDKIHAHKVVLSMRSPVFEAMLYGPLSAEKECEINIEDVDAETFSSFLRFIYTDAIVIGNKSVLKVLYLANKYSLAILEERCADFLKRSIDVDKVCTIHDHAALYGLTELQSRCFEFIIKHGEAVLQSDTFLTITQATLQKIVSHDNLSIDEKKIFDATVRWSRQQCKKNRILESAQNMRTQLGEVLYSIRFPVIPMETFAQEVCPSQLLTTEEENHLFRYMAASNNSSNQGGHMVSKFSNRARKGIYVVVNFCDFEVDDQDKNRRRGLPVYYDLYKFNDSYVRHVLLYVRPTYPVNLHAIVCKGPQVVKNIKYINLNRQRNTIKPKQNVLKAFGESISYDNMSDDSMSDEELYSSNTEYKAKDT